MQYFLFLTANSDAVWITYKKLVNWVSFYSSGKIEDYFFSFNVIFVIWPIKFPLKFEFLVWGFLSCLSKTEGSFLRDFWIMFHTHSKPNCEPRIFFPYTISVQILTSLKNWKKCLSSYWRKRSNFIGLRQHGSQKENWFIHLFKNKSATEYETLYKFYNCDHYLQISLNPDRHFIIIIFFKINWCCSRVFQFVKCNLKRVFLFYFCNLLVLLLFFRFVFFVLLLREQTRRRFLPFCCQIFVLVFFFLSF